MVKNIFVKIFAALMAVWAAWSLGCLALQLQSASLQAEALHEALEETREAIEALDRDEPEDLMKSMGYVYRGDIVFFDGG